MKLSYLLPLLAAFAFTATTSRAASTDLPRLTVNGSVSSAAFSGSTSLPTLSGRGSDFAINLHQATSSANFAELSSSKSIPLPSPWVLAIAVTLGVLVFRVYGLHHAREMADHERDMHRAKAQMYKSLQDR
jgi:hypothetical protein